MSENAGIDEIIVNVAAISAKIVSQSADKHDFFMNGNKLVYNELYSINISFSIKKKNMKIFLEAQHKSSYWYIK